MLFVTWDTATMLRSMSFVGASGRVVYRQECRMPQMWVCTSACCSAFPVAARACPILALINQDPRFQGHSEPARGGSRMILANGQLKEQHDDDAKHGSPRLPSDCRPASGGSAREQIREVKDQVVGQAKSTLQQARDRASSSLGESKGQFAEQFGTIAAALRRTTEHLRSEDQQRIAGLTESVARQVDEVATYLRNKDARAMRADLENLARRQPALMLGGALVLGLIGARFLKSSQRDSRVRGSQSYSRE